MTPAAWAEAPSPMIAAPDAAAEAPDPLLGRRRPAAEQSRRSFDEGRRRRAAQRRAAALAGPPSDDDVARLLAEFHARGGRVTECPPAHAAPVNNGAGRDASRWTI
ncbi:hypothetical protein GCM10010964_44610 [Caldovatus sediminis]|uniref:Uncharacterized protein n=2 Tax=Caldovatus sediminis TaxID=2041189 RepID=A0A8J3ED58_9PROT|nr:hypothetical protein GCM10010964_44610 [Caldovatus sediminis]